MPNSDINIMMLGYVAHFFTAAFLCNAIPHLASGLQGKPFPSPFAKPRGVGDSSPLVNFLWGAFNFFLGLCLLARFPVSIGCNLAFIIMVIGALAVGAHMSWHFGKVHRDKIAAKLNHN